MCFIMPQMLHIILSTDLYADLSVYIEWATEATQALVTILLSFASPSQYLPLPHLSAHISPTNQSHLDPIHLESATVFWSQIQVSPLPLCPLFNAWLSSPLSSLPPLDLQEIISALIKAFAVSHNQKQLPLEFY